MCRFLFVHVDAAHSSCLDYDTYGTLALPVLVLLTHTVGVGRCTENDVVQFSFIMND